MTIKQNLPARRDDSASDIIRRSQRKRLRKHIVGAAVGAFLEAICEIPGLKTATKMHRAARSFRDELFENKVASFLGELADVDQEALRRFVDELAADAGTRKKAGQALALILDRLDDMEKPEVVGRLYLAALQHRLSLADLRRFCMIVDRAHLPDLAALSRLGDKEKVDPNASQFMHALGLAEITGTDFGTVDGIGADTWYEVSALGRKFLAVAFPPSGK